jgi:hypothetical protein
MGMSAARSASSNPLRPFGEALRVAFLGSEVWLDGCFPAVPMHGLIPERFQMTGTGDAERTLGAVDAFQPHIAVIFDPPSVPVDALPAVPGVTLGVLVAGVPEQGAARAMDSLDRLVSFTPALTGARIGSSEVWRAIPPPVSDLLYGEVHPLHRAPRAISIGRSSAHRETMLMPVKHHHDLLQVIHGVSGEPLGELLREYDVGVYVSSGTGGGFGHQVGVHLAAGHLLLSEDLAPAHGLERNIDYLHVGSPDGLVWVLDRLARFPEMHHRIRVRGRLKAEQYRASRIFSRLAHDLLADVAAFGVPGAWT